MDLKALFINLATLYYNTSKFDMMAKIGKFEYSKQEDSFYESAFKFKSPQYINLPLNIYYLRCFYLNRKFCNKNIAKLKELRKYLDSPHHDLDYRIRYGKLIFFIYTIDDKVIKKIVLKLFLYRSACIVKTLKKYFETYSKVMKFIKGQV